MLRRLLLIGLLLGGGEAYAQTICSATPGCASTGVFFGPVQFIPGTFLVSEAANTLALRNSTAAQTFRIYNTFTDASNYERATLTWSSNVFRLNTEAAGTGTVRDINIGNGNSNIRIADNGSLGLVFNGSSWSPLYSATNRSYDLGGTVTQWRNAYVAGIQGAYPTTLVDNTIKTFAVVDVPSDSYAGGDVVWTVYCANATDRVARSGRLPWSAVNDGGTETCVVGTTSSSGDAGGTTGPPTFAGVTFACIDAGTNQIGLRVQADCSLTPTTLTIQWRLDMPQPNTVTPQS